MKDVPQVRRKLTKQKRLILDVLKNTKLHPTADWVYAQVKKKIPNVSLGTIYRNLDFFTKQGEIIALNYGKGFSLYDGNLSDHYHFTCKTCGVVLDLDMPVLFGLNEDLSEKMGLKVHSHRLEFYGECPACITAQKQPIRQD